MLLLVVVHILVQLACARHEARHALQVGEEQPGGREQLRDALGKLLGQRQVLDHLGQVLAPRARGARARSFRRAVLAGGLARACPKVLAGQLELLLELREQRLARGRELLEDELTPHELLVPRELAQQRVALEARRAEPRGERARDDALDGHHRLFKRGGRGLPRGLGEEGVVLRLQARKGRATLATLSSASLDGESTAES